MTVVAERSFVVTVKLEGASLPAIDEATSTLRDRLQGAVPGRLSGLRVLSKDVIGVTPRGESFVKTT